MRKEVAPKEPQQIATWEDELKALQVCVDQIAKLDGAAQQRAMRYIADRFGIYMGST